MSNSALERYSSKRFNVLLFIEVKLQKIEAREAILHGFSVI
jgi:hypothetical protein